MIDKDPESLPAAVGSKLAVNVAVPPAWTVSGSDSFETLNSRPFSVTFVIIKSAVPLFMMWSTCVVVLPATTVEKLIGEGDTAIVGEPLADGLPADFPVPPMQPAAPSIPARQRAVAIARTP